MSGWWKLYKLAKDILKEDLKNQYNLDANNVFECLDESLKYYRLCLDKANSVEKRILIHNLERIKYFMYLSFDKENNTGKRRKWKETMALVYYFLNK